MAEQKLAANHLGGVPLAKLLALDEGLAQDIVRINESRAYLQARIAERREAGETEVPSGELIEAAAAKG